MRRKEKSIKLNIIMNAILTISSLFFPLITFPYISRILLPDGMGKISFATSIVSYFSILAQLGIPIYGVRVCSKVRNDKDELSRVTHELIFINLIMNVVCYLFFFFFLLIVPRLQEDKFLYLILSITIFFNTIGVEWLYKALEEYTYITIRSVILKLLALIAVFILVHKKNDYYIYAFITVFASSASNVLNFVNLKKYINTKFVGGYKLKKHFKPIGIFFAMACAQTIYINLDTVMLGFMTTETEVGYYNAAIKVKQVLTSLVTSLGAVLLPRASYYVEKKMIDEFKRITTKALEFVFIIASPVSVFFILYAKESIYLLAGESYEGAIAAMQIMLPTVLIIGITNIWGIQMLVPLGKEKIVLYSEITGAITDIIVNAFLIPVYGCTGAAIGTLIAECVVLLVQYQAVKAEVNKTLKHISYIKILIAVSIGALLGIRVKLISMNLFGELMTASILFFGTYVLTLFFLKEKIVFEIFCTIKERVIKFIKKMK